MSELVLTEDRDAVRHVILNRPEKRNAFNEELILALGAALRTAADDPAVRVVVLRGNGPVFSAGMDVGALAGAASAPERLRAFRRDCLDAWNLCEEMLKPTVCVIHGACLGGALELALACDLRVMAEDAVVGLPETRLGLVPDVGGASRLPQVVGVGRAKELILTSRVIGAVDAERYGLVNRIGGMDVASALVDELLGCAPLAVGLAKRLIDASARPALSTTLELEVSAQEQCMRSQDVREGVAAAAERRAPVWTGR
ncbi:enoyl-CoA hydratase/isomerase family protein [Solirubrobacter sp. CPCC 204708]|uniref:Enoyl-CoA hydratase/isomerase family protein n=1 Tax=Solirubrobacter deserti TaxID=2282478 RepID=A0ABT4RF87_9ACTN|nr:enoyl-CoA hydratase/isomerase family protein [Solirubrobacter deserti]MBE2319497.1 enoyl-CoA hydratase/isomerase family protein [Solirubrobacter deserti]MDA0137216.1 enoyl-CoA hydratase/isomerase family protein [Solirubrobacter deserti]